MRKLVGPAGEGAGSRRSLRRPPVFPSPYILRTCMLQARPRSLPRFLLIAYALVLGVEAAANIWINFIGKGRTWDLYPLAQAFWVACSVVAVIVVARTSARSAEPTSRSSL